MFTTVNVDDAREEQTAPTDSAIEYVFSLTM
jgi:hypothetical protein